MVTLHGIWSVAKICAVLGLAAALGYILLLGVGLVLMVPIAIICGAYSLVMTAFIMFLVACQLTLSFVATRFLSVLGIEKNRRAKFKSNTTQSNRHERNSQRHDRESAPKQPFDPYRILQVTRAANPGQIKAAYHRQISQYHPDKVAHLGADLRALAEEKTKNIQQAYSTLAHH